VIKSALNRILAGIGSAMLIWLLWQWLPNTDVFVVYRTNCPPRAGTIWPFLLAAGAGLVAPGYALWGSWTRFFAGLRKLTIRAALWWGIALLWSIGCLYVFVRNISFPVARVSFLGLGGAVGGITLFVVALVAITLLLSIPYNLKRRRAAADLARMPQATRRQMLALIDQHSRTGNFQLLYLPRAATETAVDAARVGGEPAALPNESWPSSEEDKPALFLLQLPLSAPRLPRPWQGRMLTIFLTDHELHIRSYPPEEHGNLVRLPAPAGATLVSSRQLECIAVPYVPLPSDPDEEFEIDISVGELVDSVPTLRTELEKYTRHPNHVLSGILADDPRAFPWSEDTAVLSGGDPLLIQAPHKPTCSLCQQPMRFLLQFGDMTDDQLLGDVGVGYLYGCDEHPDRCVGFVDCH